MKFILLFLLIPIVHIGCNVIVTRANRNSSGPNNTPVYQSCATQSCDDAVKSMAESIDPAVDPCDDFYQFTCGSNMNSNNWFMELLEKNGRQVLSSLEEAIEVNDPEPVKIVKNIYQSCVNESAIEEQGLAPFLDIMEQIGGWPVLKENKTWNETAFNWKKVLFKIGNETYWDNMFVPLKSYGDLTNITRWSIIVSEPTLRISGNVLQDGTNSDEVQNYFEYMVDMAVSMGANQSFATKELTETLQFEIQLLNITIAGRMFHDRNLYQTNYSHLLDKRITISELMKNYSFIPWDEYIKFYLPSSVSLDDMNDRVIVTNLNYINDLKNLIESTPKRVVANYVVWRHLDGFADHLTKNIRNFKMNYENTINLYTIPEEERLIVKCVEIIGPSTRLILNMMYNRKYSDKNSESNVNIIVNNIQNEFVGLLKNASWMDEETKNRTIDKATSLNRIIGYPKELFDDSKTKIYLQNLQFIKDNNVANFYMLLTHQKKIEAIVLDPIYLDELRKWGIYGVSTMVPNPLYNPYGNILFAPTAIIQDPFYSYHNPMFMNYGKIGFFLGHEIAHGFDLIKHKLDKNNNTVDWPNATDTIYNQNAECIVEQYSNYTEGWTARATQDEDIADNIGMKATYYAYKKYAHMDKSEKIKNKEYTPLQMFWISSANTWCGILTLDPVHNTGRNRVIGPLSNMKEFAEDFNCPMESPMNPSKKCQVL